MLGLEIKVWIGLTLILIIAPIVILVWRNFFRIGEFVKSLYNKIEYKKNLEKIKQEIINRRAKKTKKKPIEPEKLSKNKEIISIKMEKYKFEALSYKEKGDFDKYEQKLIEGLALDNRNIEFTRMLGDLYFNLGIHKKALPLLKRILENEPTDHKAIWQIGQIYFDKNDFDTAKLLVEKALSFKPDNPKYLVSLAEIMYSKESLEDAINHMQEALKLRPSNINYLLGIASLYEELGEKDEAKKYYFKVLEMEPNNATAKEKISSL